MRRGLSRFLLLALVAACVAALARLFGGEDEAPSDVTFGTDLAEGQLYHRAFEATRPVRVAVHAVGSFEDEVASDTALAALGWLVRRSDGAVVWRMDPKRLRRGRGTLAEAADTVGLDHGVYDAYFASFGDPDAPPAPPEGGMGGWLRRLLSRDGRAWLADVGRWRFRLAAAREDEREAIAARDDAPEAAAPQPEGLVWASGPVPSGERREWLFEVTAPTALHVRALAEGGHGMMADRASVTRLGDGGWAMRFDGSAWAGGARRNRRADTTLALAPGLYRAAFETDDGHAWEDWTGNPPFVPAAWGLQLLAADASSAARVRPLDPWGRLPRLARFDCVGPEAEREATFALADSLLTLIHAEGEVVGSTVYDGARLLRRMASGEAPDVVWEMEADATRPAGGADKNRQAEAFLALAPGTYTLQYHTDGSHDCSGFNSDPPDAPDRWGATLFALDPAFDLARVRYVRDPKREPPPPATAADSAWAAAGGQAGGAVLARLDGLGSDTLAAATFVLTEPSPVRLYAVGEIVPSERLDYGWITDAAGATVWEMTRENTAWAGGSKKNRAFGGRLDLPAGTYAVHFRTDGAHAYGHFDQPPPNDPAAWGIVVRRE